VRRGVLPLLLILLALGVALWLALRAGDESDSGDEIGRAAEEEDEAPPMLKGTGEAGAPASDAAVETPPDRPAARPGGEGERKDEAASAPEVLEGEATLVVRVKDAQGRPRPGLRIRLYVPIGGNWEFTHDVELDETGEVRFDDAYPSRAYLWIDDANVHRSRRVQLDAAKPTEVDVVVPVGGTITGTARHREKGVLAGIYVVVEIKEQACRATCRTRTDAEGRFCLEGVPPGTHGMALHGQALDYNQRPRAQVVVRDGETVHKNIVLGQVMLTGRVRDAATGEPLPEVGVNVGSLYLPTTTDASGTFRVVDLPPGSYYLGFYRDGYQRGKLDDVEVSEGAITEVGIDLQPAGLVVLRLRTPEGRTVTGTAQFQFSPVQGQGTYASAERRTDGYGVARCERIRPGTYLLRTLIGGYEVEPARVEVGRSETPIDVVCRPVAREGVPLLSGVVRDARTEEPVPGATIAARQGFEDPAITNEEGRYALWWRGEGSVDLIVSRDGYGIRFLRGVRLKQGEGTRLDIELTPAAVLHLWLTNARGDPVVGKLTLVIHPKKKEPGLTSVGTSVRADAAGHAVYEEIVPGDYEFTVIDEQAGRGKAEAAIQPGENVVRIQLAP
jgi:hypothetical protein